MMVCLQPSSQLCTHTLAFSSASETDRLRAPWLPLIADQLIRGPLKCGFKNAGFQSGGFSAEEFSFKLGPLWSALRNQDQVEVDGG